MVPNVEIVSHEQFEDPQESELLTEQSGAEAETEEEKDVRPPESNREGWEDSCFCRPEGRYHRFIGLVLMCLLGLGSGVSYHNPGALESQIKKSLGISSTQFSYLYFLYQIPNTVLPIVGGFLMDGFGSGIRLGAVAFAGLVLIGQIIFAVGAFAATFWIMAVGRFIFGIGGELLTVAQTTFVVTW